MPMKLQEVHPSIVHFPIAFLPMAIVADLLGRATESESLMEVGRVGIALAAGGAAAAALTGLMAQQEVKVEGHTLDMLITHRNLNLGAVATATALATHRWSAERPTTGYLLAGLAAIGVVSYSAYLGGHMVYEHGVGVSKADGVREDVPELTPSDAGRALRTAGRDLADGVRTTAQELREGKYVPYLRQEIQGGGSAEAGA